jgi:long-chain acyl-CoA synthetase
MFILPTMLRFLVEEQARAPRAVSCMRVCLAGGDTVPVTLQEGFYHLFGTQVRELYGMTETVPVTCIPSNQTRTGSVGTALHVLETRVSGFDGRVVADYEVGELQVLSPANCIGYWDDAKSTNATFDDGWLRTGDLVMRDSDGFFWFKGRTKQIIVRGGSNISPQEVEEALYDHPAVLEAGVVGAPDPIQGETVMAFVALRRDMTATEHELISFVKARIADYKTPERVMFLPVLPKGLTGKVQRRALTDLMAAPFK